VAAAIIHALFCLDQLSITGERRLDPNVFANASLNKLLRIFRHNFFSEDSTPLAKLAKWREVEMHGHLFKTEQSLGLLSSSSKEIVIFLQVGLHSDRTP